MMKVICPFCENTGLYTVDSRPGASDSDYLVKRRRLCKNCGRKFNTYEVVDIDIHTSLKYSEYSISRR